jgi:hypothetical protein
MVPTSNRHKGYNKPNSNCFVSLEIEMSDDMHITVCLLDKVSANFLPALIENTQVSTLTHVLDTRDGRAR